MAKIGLERARVAGQRPGVQGITSNLDDLLLRDGKWKAKLGDALIDGTLVRTIGGASTIKLEVHDHKRDLLNSKHLQRRYDLSLDGLPFRFVKAASAGLSAPLELTHEARAVSLLRALLGPHKAFRNQVTRAEFAKRRVAEARPRLKFICPQLHVVQPIENVRQSEEFKKEAKERRGKGIGDEELTVKGIKATKAQRDAANDALNVAASLDAPARVMIALMAALIVESLIGGVSSNWLQIIPSTASAGNISPNNLVQSVRGFLRGYYSGHEGAIAYFKNNPDAKAYEIAQAVQASGAGAASNGAANYGPVVGEAAEFVEAYGGGSISTVEFTRYAFEQPEKESNWACITRLAKEVRWRCFESANWIYYIDDQDLLDSVMRMVVSDSTPGIEDTRFDYDIGKEVTEMTVTARAREWAAPPGSVAQVRRHGPANGKYIVHRIESPLRRRNSLCEITLRRPMEPLPEPAPESKTISVSLDGSSANDPGGVKIQSIKAGDPYWGGSAAIFKQFVHPFMEKEGLSPGAEKEEGHTEGSDHALTSELAYATDYPTSGDALARIADALGHALGRSGSSVGTYERFTVSVDGYSFSVQILARVEDHFDHIHVGIERQ